MKDKEINTETLMSGGILDTTDNSEGMLSALGNTQKLSADDLKKVFAWCSLHRREIDKVLTLRLKGAWPKSKKDELPFYEQLLNAIVHDGNRQKIEKVLHVLTKKMHKKKKMVFFPYNRFFSRAMDEAEKIDANLVKQQIHNMRSGTSSVHDVLEAMVELLNDNGRTEFDRVFNQFFFGYEEENEIVDEDRKLSLGEEWNNKKRHIGEICNQVRTNIDKLALGIEINVEDLSKKVDDLIAQSDELRQSILSVSEGHNFPKEHRPSTPL